MNKLEDGKFPMFVGCYNNVKMIILPKNNLQIHSILIKIPLLLFTEIKKS